MLPNRAPHLANVEGQHFCR